MVVPAEGGPPANAFTLWHRDYDNIVYDLLMQQ
jgi:hypothetical protein